MSLVRRGSAAVAASCVGLATLGSGGLDAPASAHGSPVGGAGNVYHLNNAHVGGAADLTYTYGSGADVVLVGDWDGNGTDTLAVRRGNTYYLNNRHAGGTADYVYTYGAATDVVLVGDWDGNGSDTLAVRRGNTYYLNNRHAGGTADLSYVYGSPTDVVMTGNWDGLRGDTLGVRRGNTYYLNNSHAGGAADLVYTYGSGTDTHLVGDWDGSRTDTLGVRRPLPALGRFVRAVHGSGRFFLDETGTPILVRGDSPWSMFTDLSPAEVSTWAANRQANGFNAAVVSLVGARDNGAPSDTGATYDGVLPFVDGDITRPNPAYWERVEGMVATLRDHGITAFLYPVDGWNVDNPETFEDESADAFRTYGELVARRFAGYPNVVWVTGGDYVPATDEPELGSAVDHRLAAMLEGLRSAGDRRPFSIQLGDNRSISAENPFWADRVDWNFVSTYYPTYEAVLAAYRMTPQRPALFAEGNYERENNQPNSPPTTDETLRRQLLWALTSGSPGDFYGSDDWEFHAGWETRLTTTAVTQLKGLRSWFAGRAWYRLVPDTGSGFLTFGRSNPVGPRQAVDVLQSDYASAALAADRTWGVIYVPTARTIGVSATAVSSARDAYWLDPCSLARSASVAIGREVAHPGTNSCGATDWLFVVDGA